MSSLDEHLTCDEEITQDKMTVVKHAKDVIADLKQQDRDSSTTTSKLKPPGSSSED